VQEGKGRQRSTKQKTDFPGGEVPGRMAIPEGGKEPDSLKEVAQVPKGAITFSKGKNQKKFSDRQRGTAKGTK